MGYFDITDSLVRIDPSRDIRITLRESNYVLPDIAVSASSNRIEKSDKIIYKLSSSDYIKGAQADIALRNIPNLSVVGDDIKLENRKSVTIFIDGIASSFTELTAIKADDIDKVEVISNPSFSFGSELSGGVINIIRKNKIEHSFKGELSVGKGVRLGEWRARPMFAYQNKFITFNAYYSYRTNNQNNIVALDRNFQDGGVSSQRNDRKTTGGQDNLSARMRLVLSPKSDVILVGNMSGYRFSYENDVLVKLPETDDFTAYAYNSKEGKVDTRLDALYKYEIKKDHKFYVKGRYMIYSNWNETNYMEGRKVNSGIAEYSAEGVYERTNIPVLSRFVNMVVGYKHVYREYELEKDLFVYQTVHSVYGDFNADISNKLSLSASFMAEYTGNTAEGAKHNYNRILPVFSLLYKLPYQTSIRLNYSNRITRPSADYLNPNPIVLSPLQTLVGNIRLLPQDRYNYEAGITKRMKNGKVLSLTLNHNTTTNLISETLTTNGDMVITSYDNLGSAYRNGLSAGFYGKLFNWLTLNVNNGINYHYLSSVSDREHIIVNENKGYSYNATVDLSTVLWKRIWVDLGGTYNSRDYSLVRTLVTQPLFMLNVQTNLFKDRLRLELSCMDIFSTYSKIKMDIHSPNFSQTMLSTSNLFNVTLRVVYRFGKVFNDNFRTPTINNDDIITK
jgi:outer membrane receptor protein involved in Fe transport